MNRSIIMIALITLNGCAAVKKVVKTLDDAADIACHIFGTEHPEEFEQLARSVLPPGAINDAEASGFNPAVLCDIKEVLQPFIDDQIQMQSSKATSLKNDE